MPPSRYAPPKLEGEISTGVGLLAQIATLDNFRQAGLSNMALPIAMPIMTVFVLIVATHLMPKGAFLSLAIRMCSQYNKGKDKASFLIH